MLSFFGEQCLKDAVVARVREHQRLDQIVQGTYWDGERGCADSQHDRRRRIDGIPFSARAFAWAAEGAAEIHRQADYLIALLESYDSKPILMLAPCEEALCPR